jgi:hypothetical protein
MTAATVSLVAIPHVWTVHETSRHNRSSPKKFHVCFEFHENLAHSDWLFHELLVKFIFVYV